jgi:hypothetical protein
MPEVRNFRFNIKGGFSYRGFDTHGASKIIRGMNKGSPNEEDLRPAEEFAGGLRDRRPFSYNVKN